MWHFSVDYLFSIVRIFHVWPSLGLNKIWNFQLLGSKPLFYTTLLLQRFKKERDVKGHLPSLIFFSQCPWRMGSCMRLFNNLLVSIFSVSSVFRRSTARLPTYCYGYHLDKYNPTQSAHPSLWDFPADSLLTFLSGISLFYFTNFHSLFLNQSSKPSWPVFTFSTLSQLLWKCSVQFPDSPNCQFVKTAVKFLLFWFGLVCLFLMFGWGVLFPFSCLRGGPFK